MTPIVEKFENVPLWQQILQNNIALTKLYCNWKKKKSRFKIFLRLEKFLSLEVKIQPSHKT